MIDCISAETLAACAAVGIQSEEEAGILQEHLRECSSCRSAGAEFATTASLLPLALEPMKAPPELRRRILQEVYKEARPAAVKAPVLQGLWAKLSPRMSLGALSLAAAAAVAFALVGHPPAPRNAPVAPVAVTLTGSNWAPLAKGTAVYDASFNATLVSVENLPSPQTLKAAGGVYELWLIPKNGNAVPAGFLTQEPNGHWQGVVSGNDASYQAMAATLEPLGGSPLPTGYKVLVGSIS